MSLRTFLSSFRLLTAVTLASGMSASATAVSAQPVTVGAFWGVYSSIEVIKKVQVVPSGGLTDIRFSADGVAGAWLDFGIPGRPSTLRFFVSRSIAGEVERPGPHGVRLGEADVLDLGISIKSDGIHDFWIVKSDVCLRERSA